jgi:CBS domain-containing protein
MTTTTTMTGSPISRSRSAGPTAKPVSSQLDERERFVSQEIADRYTAADIMSTHLVVVESRDSLRDVVTLLVENHVSGAPVVDDSDRCVGVISATDILSYEQEHGEEIDARNADVAQVFDAESQRWESVRLSAFALERIADVRVADLMSRQPVTVRPTTGLPRVARIMTDQRVHRVVVTDNNKKVVGLISAFDFVRFLANPSARPLGPKSTRSQAAPKSKRSAKTRARSGRSRSRR